MKSLKNVIRLVTTVLLVIAGISFIAACQAEDTASGWQVYRLAGGLNADGETCSADEFEEEFLLGLHSAGSGFVYSESGARAFQWEAAENDILVIAEHDMILIMDDPNHVRMINRYDYQAGSPYIRLESADEANESDSMVGLWCVSDPINVLDIMEAEPWFRFEADGTLMQVYDKNSLAGALVGEVNMGLWIGIDGKVLNMEPGREEVSVLNYTVLPEEKSTADGEKMRYFNIDDGTVLPVTEFPKEVPLHYDSSVRYEAWSGIWSIEEHTEDSHLCMILRLNADGTGTYSVSDNLVQPKEIMGTLDVSWHPVSEGALLEVQSPEGLVEMILSEAYGRTILTYDDQQSQLKKNPWLPMLLESAQQHNADLLALAGAWDYEGGTEKVSAAQIELRLDGSAILRNITGEADPRERSLVTESNLRWVATDHGVKLIFMNEDETEEIEFVLQDGKLTQEDMAFIRTVDANAWNGNGYDYEPLAYYMSSGYAGVWSAKQYLVTNDPFEPEDQIELRLSPDGHGVLWIKCGDNRKDIQGELTWRPGNEGIEFCMLTEISGAAWLRTDRWLSAKYFPDEKRLSLYESGNSINFVQSGEYWSEEKTVVEAEPIVSYSLQNDGTIVLTEYFTESDTITIPERIDNYAVSALGANLFRGNRSIRQVTIPEGVLEIGTGAFADCTQLQKVTLPDSLKIVGDEAFRGCESAKIKLPTSLKRVGSSAFQDCSGLSSVEFDLDEFVIGDSAFSGSGVGKASFFGKRGTIGTKAFYSCHRLTQVDMSDFNGTVGGDAFAWCSALRVLELPQEECKFDQNAFCGCSVLEEISIPGGIKEVAAGMFNDCKNLKTVVVEEGITRISNGAFYACSALQSITLPEGITSIGASSFQYCVQLPFIQLPEGVVEIGACCFDGNSVMKQVVMPESLQKIDNWAFRGCVDLEKLHISNSKAELLYGILEGTRTVIVGKSGSTAEAYARENGLEFLPEDQTTVAVGMAVSDDFMVELRDDGTYCIAKYTGTETDLVIPAQYDGLPITAIGTEAFAQNENLHSITLESNILSIGDKAFFGCSNLEKVVIPAETEVFGRFAFVNCPKLTVYVSAGTAAEQYADANRLQKSITG